MSSFNITLGGSYTGNSSSLQGSGTITVGNQVVIDGVIVAESTSIEFVNDGTNLSFNGVPFENFKSGLVGPITVDNPTGTPIATTTNPSTDSADTTSTSTSQAPAGFDAEFYLQNNPDVAAAGVDPTEHYLNFGAKEGRDPNGSFDESFYLSNNPDVAASVAQGGFTSGYAHYIAAGQQEGRLARGDSEQQSSNTDTSPSDSSSLQGFDFEWYLAQNPDVAEAGMDALEHYQLYGMKEGRDPNANFDESFYLSNNQDVADAVAQGGFTSGYDHYLNYGANEGRIAIAGTSDIA